MENNQSGNQSASQILSLDDYGSYEGSKAQQKEDPNTANKTTKSSSLINDHGQEYIKV